MKARLFHNMSGEGQVGSLVLSPISFLKAIRFDNLIERLFSRRNLDKRRREAVLTHIAVDSTNEFFYEIL